MNTAYARSLTLRAARDLYFAANGFGEDGGYSAQWVDFKLGPIPLPFPNTAARVRAVVFHDLHHILTGYTTDIVGEFEISAWEIGAGCKDFFAAWHLNLSGLATGVVVSPRRVFRAFVRGRRARSLYGQAYEALLDRTVGEVRDECGVENPAEARAGDYALFVAAWAVGTAVGLTFLATLAVVGPMLFIAGHLRARAPRSPMLVDPGSPR